MTTSTTMINTSAAHSTQMTQELEHRLSESGREARRRLGTAALLLAALLAAAVVGFLSGCGSSNTDSATTPGAQTTAANAVTSPDGKVQVVASFYPLYDFATKVGGDHVEVTNLVPAGTEPHDWEPAPTDITKIQNADVLVYNGASMESWVPSVLDTLGDDGPVTVEASDGLQLRAGEEEHEDGDGAATEPTSTDLAATTDTDNHDHGTFDPHVWLAPENAKHEMVSIKDALVKVDPAHKDDYEANYEKYAKQFDELDQQYREKLSAVPNKTIVVSHEAFGYLCDAYGLTQIPITGMDAEGEPDAQTMASIIDQVKQTGIKTIFSEDLVSPKIAQQIADATGATCEVLNPIEGLAQDDIDKGEDYFSVMQSNLDELVSALS